MDIYQISLIGFACTPVTLKAKISKWANLLLLKAAALQSNAWKPLISAQSLNLNVIGCQSSADQVRLGINPLAKVFVLVSLCRKTLKERLELPLCVMGYFVHADTMEYGRSAKNIHRL